MNSNEEDYSEDELKRLMEEIKVLNQFSTDNTGMDFENYFKDVFKYDFQEKDKIITKFINNSTNSDPDYAKVGDSGFDLRAFINEPVTLKPLERKLIPTGLKFELSPNTELQVRPRSGMALKHGISVLNTPGTVDEGYRGEVGVIAVNLSNEDYTIEPGERIAQGVIMNVVGQGISKLTKVESLTNTDRGDGGFGSTGKQ
jgi:dUTP pyrophosphatase